MILLDYLPSIFVTLALGAFVAFFVKMLITFKKFKLSFVISALTTTVFILPFVIYGIMKKRRSELLRHVNKNKTLNEQQKKEAKRVISSNFRLFWLILKFTFSNYRQIFHRFIDEKAEEIKAEVLTEEKPVVITRSIVVTEATVSLSKGLTKPLESYLSKIVI